MRRVLLFLSLFSLAGALSAVSVWFTSLPSSANSGEGYYVEAAGWVGWYGGDLSIWKNGQWHAGTNGWDWLSAGNWSTDHGAQAVEYWAETWDWMVGESAFTVGYVSIQAAPSNQAPTPWLEVDGHGHGATYTRPYGQNGSVTVRYKTTDPDSNLWGIRPQVWHPGTGLFTNDGGAWSGASGGYAELVRSITLDRDGDWYFWTDAQDAPGVFANSGAWGDAYRLHVVQGAPPNTPPVASVVIDGQSHGGAVTRPAGGTTSVTVRYRATDANGNLWGVRPQVWHPGSGLFTNDGGNWTGASGGQGELVRTITLDRDGDWYFWTDAQDTNGAFVNSGAWGDAYRLNITQGADTTPPGTPFVSLSLIAAESFTASWNNPGDNIGVTGYQWRLNGGAWNDTTATTHAISGLTPSTTYNVEVRARDAAGNWSNAGSALATTSGAGGGTTTGQSFYADVDGDGLYDEIVRPGTPDFSYRITAWYTAHPSYRNILVNDYWNPFSIFWRGPASSDGLLSRPDFSRIWLFTQSSFWLSYETYFRATFTYNCLAGERVGIFQDPQDGPDTNPAAWSTILAPTVATTTGTCTIIPPQFDGDLFAGSKFFMVRYGLPAAGMQMALPNLGLINSFNGTVVLPGGGIMTVGSGSSSITIGGITVSVAGGTVSVTGGGGLVAPGTSITVGGVNVAVDSSGNVTITPPGGGPVQSISVNSGGANVVFGNGVGVSVAPGGQIGLSVPPGTVPIIPEIINAAGRVQSGNAAGAVRYVLRDLLGIVTPQPGPITDIIGILAGETKQLGIDNAGTILWLTKPAGPQIAFVRDSQNDHQIDTNDPAVSYLRVGRWGEDRADGGMSGYGLGQLGTPLWNATPNNFIDQDPERFYVRLVDPRRNTNPNSRQTIVADLRIGSLQASGHTDDDLTTTELVETADNSGIFVSQSQLLMSEDIADADDDYSVAGLVANDDSHNDRTHRVTVDGLVKVEYAWNSTTTVATVPVSSRSPNEIKMLTVVIHNFNEPWEDDNSNGVRDSNERFIDISSGATDFALSGTWSPIWTNEQIDLQIRGLRAGLAQARVKIVETARHIWNPPLNLFRQSGLAEDGAPLRGRFDSTFDDVIFEPGLRLSRDHVAIQSSIPRPAQFTADESDDVLDVFFVAPFSKTNTAAVSLDPGWISKFPDLNIPLTMANQIFISYKITTLGFYNTSAHEVMHQLTNADDDNSVPDHILFPENGSRGENPNWGRRLQESIIQKARTTRPANDLSASGNRLLRSQ